MSTNVLTDNQLHARYIGFFFAGLFIALLAYAWPRWAAPAPVLAEESAPRILSQTADETVARITTLREGRPVVCTLAINHRTRSWSLSC